MSSVKASGGMSYADLMQIVEVLRDTAQFSEFRLKVGEIEFEVRRGGPAPATPAAAAAPPAVVPRAAAPVAPASVSTPMPATPAASPAAPPAAVARHSPTAVPVQAPMVGTFYCAPEPGAEPFVKPGQRVRAGDTLCIIEVMKLMNTLSAERDGVIVDILVADAQAVQAGQVLMLIEPA